MHINFDEEVESVTKFGVYSVFAPLNMIKAAKPLNIQSYSEKPITEAINIRHCLQRAVLVGRGFFLYSCWNSEALQKTFEIEPTELKMTNVY